MEKASPDIVAALADLAAAIRESEEPIDFSDDITLRAGWSKTAFSAHKVGRICMVECFVTKSSNIAHGDAIMSLPDEMMPIAGMLAATYTAAHGAATDKVARVNITLTETPGTAVIEIRNPSSSMTNAVFGLIWISAA